MAKKRFLLVIILLSTTLTCFAAEKVLLQETLDNAVHVTVTSFGRVTEKVEDQIIHSKMDEYDINWDFDEMTAEDVAEVVEVFVSDFKPVTGTLILVEIFEAGDLEWYWCHFEDDGKYHYVAAFGMLE
jgi:hypothetical protein